MKERAWNYWRNVTDRVKMKMLGERTVSVPLYPPQMPLELGWE
jgi:hypothetical protein